MGRERTSPTASEPIPALNWNRTRCLMVMVLEVVVVGLSEAYEWM